MAAGLSPYAAIVDRGVLQREPETQNAVRLGIEPSRILVGIDLTARLRWINRTRSLKDALLDEMLAHPGTALRLGPRAEGGGLGLVAVARSLLTAGDGEEDAVRRLVEGDLLTEEPLDALIREGVLGR